MLSVRWCGAQGCPWEISEQIPLVSHSKRGRTRVPGLSKVIWNKNTSAVRNVSGIPVQVLEQADWEDLAAQTASTAWDIRLLTPTVFTSRGHHVPEVTAASLATSLHARWRHWCRPLAPELPERERLTSVLITQDHTRRTVVGLGMPRADRRGRLSSRRIPASVGTLRISAPAAGPITAVFSQLMALARYTSVGSHSAYGMGVIDVVADAP